MTTTDHISGSTLATAPVVGASAPALTLPDETGRPVRFADRWAAAPRGVVLVFVRHFG